MGEFGFVSSAARPVELEASNRPTRNMPAPPVAPAKKEGRVLLPERPLRFLACWTSLQTRIRILFGDYLWQFACLNAFPAEKARSSV